MKLGPSGALNLNSPDSSFLVASKITIPAGWRRCDLIDAELPRVASAGNGVGRDRGGVVAAMTGELNPHRSNSRSLEVRFSASPPSVVYLAVEISEVAKARIQNSSGDAGADNRQTEHF